MTVSKMDRKPDKQSRNCCAPRSLVRWRPKKTCAPSGFFRNQSQLLVRTRGRNKQRLDTICLQEGTLNKEKGKCPLRPNWLSPLCLSLTPRQRLWPKATSGPIIVAHLCGAGHHRLCSKPLNPRPLGRFDRYSRIDLTAS